MAAVLEPSIRKRDGHSVETERKPTTVRGLLASLMGRCGQAVAVLVVRYAMSIEDEQEHNAYLSGVWAPPCDPTVYAAKRGDLLMLLWARDSGYVWSKTTGKALAANGNLGLLRWAHGEGCSFGVDACYAAAREGHLDVLRWFYYSNTVLWTWYICWQAAIGRQSAVFRWLLRVETQAGGAVCGEAAGLGDLSTLQWARRQGAPWFKDICGLAAMRGDYNMFRWIHTEGCPAASSEMNHTCQNGYVDLCHFFLARVFAERLAPESPQRRDELKRSFIQQAFGPGGGWVSTFDWVESRGLSAPAADADVIRTRLAMGLPKSEEEWEEHYWWLSRRFLSRPG